MSTKPAFEDPTEPADLTSSLGPVYLAVLVAAAMSPGVVSCTPKPWWMGFDPSDFALNIAAFLPTGWMLKRRSILVPLIAGVALPLGIEFAQRWLFRTPTPWDLAANFCGTIVGYVLAHHLDAAVKRFQLFTFANPKTLAVAFALAVFSFIAFEANRPLPDERLLWPNYPLVIGNEAGGDRPWNGEIYSLAIFDAALSPSEARAALSGRSATEPIPLLHLQVIDGVASVSVKGRDSLAPTNASLPPSVRIATDHIRLSNAEWHLPHSTAESIREAIVATNHLTIVADIKPSSEQASQGRIITLSLSPLERAFTLGTKDAAPIFRFRTEATGRNGQTPQLIANEPLLKAHQRITLCAHFDGAWSRLFANERCVANEWFPHWHGAPGIARNLLFTLALLAAACSLTLSTWTKLPRVLVWALAIAASYLTIWTLDLCRFGGFRWQVEGLVILIICAAAQVALPSRANH